MIRRFLIIGLLSVFLFGVAKIGAHLLIAQEPVAEGKSPETDRPDYTTTSLRGRVRYWDEALKEHYDIKLTLESGERLFVLETPDGELHPIAEDLRGRAFRKDERLRKMDLELRVRRFKGSPFIQVVNVYEITDKGEKYQVDYWCDICAIVMFEKGPCDCCQDHNRIRKRLTEPKRK